MTILFDLDGTLIDSTEAIVESFYAGCKECGCDVPQQEDILPLIGYPLDVMYARIGASSNKVQDCVAAYKRRYREISKEKTELLPGAREAITLAASFARIGVVTTKTARYSRELLEYFGVMRYFEVLVGREDVTHPKPHPEPIERALEKMKITRRDFVYMIGDTPLDLEASKRAAIHAVGVLSGYADKAALSVFGYPVCDDALSAVRLLLERKREKN